MSRPPSTLSLESSSRDEHGSALIGALLFVAVVSIIIYAVLSFAGVGFRIAVDAVEQREEIYAVDGGIEAAIQYLRENPVLGRGDTTDCGLDDFSIEIGGKTVAVMCQPIGDSGLAPMDGAEGVPFFAIWVEEEFTKKSQGDMTVGGPISANHVQVNGSNVLEVRRGSVLANSCNNPGLIDVEEDETKCLEGPDDLPTYAHRALPDESVDKVYQSASDFPSPCAGETEVNLQPGIYKNGSVLQSFINACGTTRVVFSPGVHFFNFDAADTWRIHNPSASARIVGGTVQLDDDGNPTHHCAPGEPGVQFVFGRGSAMQLSRGSMSLCAERTPVDRIAIFGLDYGPDALTASKFVDVLNHATFTVDGTIYAPTSSLEIQQVVDGRSVVNAGVVARSLEAQITGSSGAAGDVSVPASCATGPMADREVLLIASDGGITTSARVRFQDDEKWVPPVTDCPPAGGPVFDPDDPGSWDDEGPPKVLAWRVSRQ